jgi:hypothetical protein
VPAQETAIYDRTQKKQRTLPTFVTRKYAQCRDFLLMPDQDLDSTSRFSVLGLRVIEPQPRVEIRAGGNDEKSKNNRIDRRRCLRCIYDRLDFRRAQIFEYTCLLAFRQGRSAGNVTAFGLNRGQSRGICKPVAYAQNVLRAA